MDSKSLWIQKFLEKNHENLFLRNNILTPDALDQNFWTKILLGYQIFRTQTFFDPQIFSVVGWGGGLQSDFHVKLNFG